MRALITGDRGFLGRHFTRVLADRGWETYGLDTKATSSQDCRTYFRQDIVHRQTGAASPGFDLVVHCAAIVGGRETIENDPLKTAESLSIDAEMFRWAAVARPGRVLYISSSAAYPVGFQTHALGGYQLHEDDLWGADGAVDPDEVYGWSKVTGERLADKLRATGVPVTVVRPFSGYGADQDPSYPFRAILERARVGARPLDVWCGACVRDWIHVDDLVAGALAVVDSGVCDPVNLCTGRATSFFELAGLMLKATGSDAEVRALSDKPQGVFYRVGDPARMREFYEPRVSLEEGIRRALGV